MLVPKRVSSLMVVEDLPRVAGLYADLGFTRVPTEDDRCVGYVAGETGVILSALDFAAECWGTEVVPELAGRFVPYVFVEHIEREDAVGTVLVDARTSFGTHEVIVRTPSGPVILAERV